MVKSVYGSKKGLQIKDIDIKPKAELSSNLMKLYEPFNWRKVKLIASGWCGSDSEILEKIKKGSMKERILGHEALVFDLKEKRYAIIIVPVGCNKKEDPCSRGFRQYCPVDACAIEFAGLQGIHSEYAFIPKRCLHYIKKPSESNILRTPFYDPLSDVISTIDGLRLAFNSAFKKSMRNPEEHLLKKVLVIGAGNIGFLSASYIREINPKAKIVLTDIRPKNSLNANLAKEINAHYIQTEKGKSHKQFKNIANKTAKKVISFFSGNPSLVVWAATQYDGYLASAVSGQLTAHSVLSLDYEENLQPGFDFNKAVHNKSLIFASSGSSNQDVVKAYKLVQKWQFLDKAIDVIKITEFNSIKNSKTLEDKIKTSEKLKVIFDWR